MDDATAEGEEQKGEHGTHHTDDEDDGEGTDDDERRPAPTTTPSQSTQLHVVSNRARGPRA